MSEYTVEEIEGMVEEARSADVKDCPLHAVVGPEDVLLLRVPGSEIERFMDVAEAVPEALHGRVVVVDTESVTVEVNPDTLVPLAALKALIEAADGWRVAALDNSAGTSVEGEDVAEVLDALVDALGVPGLSR